MSWPEFGDEHREGPEDDPDERPRRAGRSTGAACTRASAGCGSTSCGATCACSASDTASRSARSGGRTQLQLEALAALAAWVSRYDSGEWDDPPGKLALLFDLERVAELLREGVDPFHPDRDRAAFVRYLIDTGCQPPPESNSRP